MIVLLLSHASLQCKGRQDQNHRIYDTPCEWDPSGHTKEACFVDASKPASHKLVKIWPRWSSLTRRLGRKLTIRQRYFQP